MFVSALAGKSLPQKGKFRTDFDDVRARFAEIVYKWLDCGRIFFLHRLQNFLHPTSYWSVQVVNLGLVSEEDLYKIIRTSVPADFFKKMIT